MRMATYHPQDPPADREEEEDKGLLAQLKRLIAPGPFPWLAKAVPRTRRFRPGTRLHGLDDHDIPEPEARPPRRSFDG